MIWFDDFDSTLFYTLVCINIMWIFQEEVIQLIVKKLDVPSLCSLAITSR